MKLEGRALLPAKREQVFELLADPQRLAKLLPGCERFEADGPDRYKVVVKFGIGAISGKFTGGILLAEKRPPSSLRMKVEGKGAAGFLRADGMVELREKDGQTELHYSGDAQVGGLIASVGQRMIASASQRIIQQFFEAAAAQLKSPPAET